MSVEIIAVIVLGTFFLLLVLGLPVAFSLITCALGFTVIFWTTSALYVASTTIVSQTTKDIYLAIPAFVFMACILEFSGIAQDLFDIMFKCIPELPGSLGVGTIGMCTLIDAMSGLGGTGVVTIGILALPEMFKHNYNKRLALGCIPSGASLGPLIPPSVLMIIIAGIMGLSVGKLFAAGVIPGLLIAALFAIYIIIACLLKPDLAPSLPYEERYPLSKRVASLKGIILPIILVVVVLGSIYTGIATPTEAAAVGAAGSAVCAGIHRRLTWANVKRATITSLRINCMVMWLLIGGAMFASMLNATGISKLVARFMMGQESATFAVLIMMAIPLIMGMFIDGAAVSVICIPIFAPVVRSLEIDPYWFGTLFTIALIAGYLTPPFGMNLFVTKGIAPEGVKMVDIYVSVLPFIGIELVVLILVFLMPNLAAWLPSLMG